MLTFGFQASSRANSENFSSSSARRCRWRMSLTKKGSSTASKTTSCSACVGRVRTAGPLHPSAEHPREGLNFGRFPQFLDRASHLSPPVGVLGRTTGQVLLLGLLQEVFLIQ